MNSRRRPGRSALRMLLAVSPALLMAAIVLLAVWLVRRPHAPPPEEFTRPAAVPAAGQAPAPLPFETMACVLVVRSRPAAAKVYLDGTYKGTTPLQLCWRATANVVRQFRLEMAATGYGPHREDIALHPGQWLTVDATLTTAPADLAPAVGGGDKIVCLDPGHPSETSAGAVAADGTTENHINWVVAGKLKSELEAAGVRVVMTKQSENEFVTNQRRAEIANECRAAVMVRLHCDSGARGNGGFAVYYPSRAGRKGKVTGPPPAVREASRRAAVAMRAGLLKAVRGTLRDNGVKTDADTAVGRDQGALTGSIFAKVPVVTVEMVFLSNREDLSFIRTDEGKQVVARGLADGIMRFIGPR